MNRAAREWTATRTATLAASTWSVGTVLVGYPAPFQFLATHEECVLNYPWCPVPWLVRRPLLSEADVFHVIGASGTEVAHPWARCRATLAAIWGCSRLTGKRAGLVQRSLSRVARSVQRTVPRLARSRPRSSILTSWGSVPNRLYSSEAMVSAGVLPCDETSPRSRASRRPRHPTASRRSRRRPARRPRRRRPRPLQAGLPRLPIRQRRRGLLPGNPSRQADRPRLPRTTPRTTTTARPNASPANHNADTNSETNSPPSSTAPT